MDLGIKKGSVRKRKFFKNNFMQSQLPSGQLQNPPSLSPNSLLSSADQPY